MLWLVGGVRGECALDQTIAGRGKRIQWMQLACQSVAWCYDITSYWWFDQTQEVSGLAEGSFKLLLPQAPVQSKRLWLQNRRDCMACYCVQRITEIVSQREQTLAIPGGLLDKLRPVLLINGQWQMKLIHLRRRWHRQTPITRQVIWSSVSSPGPPVPLLCSAAALLLSCHLCSPEQKTLF